MVLIGNGSLHDDQQNLPSRWCYPSFFDLNRWVLVPKTEQRLPYLGGQIVLGGRTFCRRTRFMCAILS